MKPATCLILLVAFGALILTFMISTPLGSHAFYSPIDETPSPPAPPDPATITLTLGSMVSLNQPVAITITVQSNIALFGADVIMIPSGPDVSVLGQSYWFAGDLLANHTADFTTQLIFSVEGQYQIVAGIHDAQGVDRSTSIRVQVSSADAIINPDAPTNPQAVIAIASLSLSGGFPAPEATPSSTAQGSANSATLGQVVVEGTISFQTRYGAMQSLSSIHIEIWDYDDPPNGDPDDLLWTTTTDANGHFTTGIFDNVDAGGTRRDIYVVYSTTTEPANLPRREVTNKDQWWQYAWTTRSVQYTAWDVPDGTVTYNSWVDNKVTNHEAAWFFEDANRTWKYLKNTRPDWEPGAISIRW